MNIGTKYAFLNSISSAVIATGGLFLGAGLTHSGVPTIVLGGVILIIGICGTSLVCTYVSLFGLNK